MVTDSDRIKKLHLEFSEDRGLDKTYCPSEVARELFPDDWREKMDLVRKVADELLIEGKLIVLQKGLEKKNYPQN
ncbi:DUF3253 domain-containing protein [Kaistella jeonii]|uniref:DUF3253 domain-containing protein n=1 Tax=Kaistella jeonii TaxID=266749 RepID=UPI0008EB4474|nr:DUF3253 domain-containing protein [Kaistella jeonii]SFB71026.1 Protein of unknown function [Kaistella jeonii]VEI94859.1 Protein of uncharacterised function (DUF3253) [Kaistella jeonii]